MRILITGGAGYIGSHTLVEVLAAGHEAHVVDNFCNSSPVALERVRRISNRAFGVTEADLRDTSATTQVLSSFEPDAVIHFAGLKAVGESAEIPLDYYDANVGGTIALQKALKTTDCRRVVFSSSATVYGDPDKLPIDEDHPLRATNPYGRTKLFIEEILCDLAESDSAWSVANLRYFNPVGAHKTGLIGEDPIGTPNNLMPFVAQVATGQHPELNIWGDDYDTPDGTGVRDFIHVTDLARAHLAAVDWTGRTKGARAFNIGTGRGTSVREILTAFERASGQKVPYRVAPRRAGDVASCFADASRATSELGWSAELGIDDMCQSLWAWQSQNPQGYRSAESSNGDTAAPANASGR